VNNNPINFNDPTGHMCSDPEDTSNPMCEGSATFSTRIGNRLARGMEPYVPPPQSTDSPSNPKEKEPIYDKLTAVSVSLTAGGGSLGTYGSVGLEVLSFLNYRALIGKNYVYSTKSDGVMVPGGVILPASGALSFSVNLIFNLDDPDEYQGLGQQVSFPAVMVGGLIFSYSWEYYKDPDIPGQLKSISISPAAGFELPLIWARTFTSLIGSVDNKLKPFLENKGK
jgi:hypothetical protein